MASERLTRFRWRRKGAWMWPAFVALTIAEAVVVHLLPISGRDTGLVPALLLAGFANLLVVALLSGPAGLLLRRRRPDLPPDVARDIAGTALLGLAAAGVLAAGIAHHPSVAAQDREFGLQARLALAFAARHAPARIRANSASADTRALGGGLYRTCIDDPARAQRAWCVYVDVSRRPARVRRDLERTPNASFGAGD